MKMVLHGEIYELWYLGILSYIDRNAASEKGFLYFASFAFLFFQTDMFIVEAVSLGSLERVIIGHNDDAPGNGWYLNKVVVRDTTRHGHEWAFMCDRLV